MAQNEKLWGIDLRLLENLERQTSRDRGSDLMTEQRPSTGQTDLQRVSELENLMQALLLRFLTPKGELTPLGHPNYGTSLYTLLGERNTQTNRNRAKMFVLQDLAREPRVAEVLRVNVTPSSTDRTRIDIEASLRPVNTETILNLVFPFFLEGV